MASLESGTRPKRRNLGARGSWVLRWDAARDRKPRVEAFGDAIPKSIAIHEARDGSLTILDGYLFDQEELRNELGAATESSAVELVAMAYERWGTELLVRLRGGFVLAIWDQRQERLLVGRDAMGLHPCFYWSNGAEIAVSSSIDAVLDRPEVPGKFNRAVIAEHLQGTYSSHQRFETFYRDVCRLPPAYRLCRSRAGLEMSRYWDPVPPGFDWASDAEIDQFQPLLERAVGRCLSAGADSIALSGGFDSVGIAVLMADQLNGRDLPFALSLRFPDPVCDESATQTEVARTLGLPQLIQSLEESVGGKSPMDASLDLSATSPCPVVSPFQAFYSGLFKSAPSGLSHLLLGTGGDDLLNVDLRYAADCLAALEFGRLWHFLRVCQRTSPFSAARIARVVLWDSAVRPEARALASRALGRISPQGKAWLRARLRRPALAHGDMVSTLDERRHTAPKIPLARGERSYVTAIRYLTQSPLLLHEHDQGFAWAQQQGFTLLYPYFDRDLTDVLLRIHPEHLLAGGRAKAPLRRMVAERLPAVTLPSKKVDFGQMIHGMLRPKGALQWRSMGGPQVLSGLGIVDSDRLNAVMEDYFSGRSDNANLIWRILSTETWVRNRSDGIDAAS